MAIAALEFHWDRWLLFCGIPSIVAVILGVIAMSRDQAHRPGGLRAGMAGTIIGGSSSPCFGCSFCCC